MIKNLSFEQNGGCSSYCHVNSETVPFWDAVGGIIELDISPWPAYDGRVSIDLSPKSESFVHQVVELVIGQKYELKFALRRNKCGNGKGFFNVADETQLVTDITGSTPFTGTNNWVPMDYTFTATSQMTRVGFGSLSGGTCGPVVDDISLFLVV
jgi:hypothetical protein